MILRTPTENENGEIPLHQPLRGPLFSQEPHFLDAIRGLTTSYGLRHFDCP